MQVMVAKMLNMTGVKVIQQCRSKILKAIYEYCKGISKDNKIKLATNNALMKMFKDAGVTTQRRSRNRRNSSSRRRSNSRKSS